MQILMKSINIIYEKSVSSVSLEYILMVFNSLVYLLWLNFRY